MEGISLDRLALGQIGGDSKDLLDSIYSLRGLGVGTSVTFPYIVVVGDQSSGKSSILEAISGMRFPIKDGVCTRFATEISVRPGLKESVHVKIIANHRDQQSAFNGKSFSKNDLPKLIEEAKGMMKVDDDATSVSEDILRINISGPELTPLFLVDLPGFCRAEISEQPTEEVSSVLRITDKYLKRKNNIILAVVSADAEIEEQSVITEVQMNDPTGERTIGIITKPDLLIPGSIKSRKYLKLAKNLEGAHILKLGWHVLRNTDCPDRNETNPVSRRASDGSGDQKKMEFSEFRDCVTFPSSNNGVDSLRQKLSKVLKRQFQLSVPNLVEAVEATIESQQNRLNSLGKARSSASEIRQYLVTIAERLKDLTYSAVGGIYDGEFFSSLDASALNEEDAYVDQRKLRAVIRNLNGAFNNVISSRGSAMRIVGCADIQFGDGCKRPGPYHWDSGLNRFEVEGPVAVPWTNLKTRLEKMALNDLGSQFPGSSNDRLALELFREQSRPWKGIAKQYLKLAMDSARMFVELALEHVTGAGENIRDAILAEYVLDYFDRKASHLNDKLEELLVHYQEGEIVCLEDEFHDYTPNETTSEVSDDDAGELRLKQVLDNMITYYEMSLQTFTNNVTVLAVENCLISKMKSVFTTTAVLEMDDDTLLRLGSESQESQRERLELQNSIAALKSDLAICKKHRPRPSSSR
ncbi:P-loop containing nucleoside triphosphate hydrolase protein, partial [Dactylonectria macrodidyma]